MPHYFPPKPFILREVCDVDALNENFQEVHSALAGLNEHNWTADCLGTESQWAENMALRVHQERTSIDPYDSASVERIDGSGQWVPVDGGEKSVVTRGGKHLLIASFQIETPLNSTTGREAGLMFAFEIDGAVEYGSLLGSADLSNDLVQQVVLPTSSFLGSADSDTGPGLRGGYIPVVIEKLVTMGEGAHTVRVVARNIQPITTVSGQVVSQMCFVALEMNA